MEMQQVKEFIKSMSLMDAAKLVKDLEEELGVSAAAPMMMAGPAAGAGAAAVEEKTEFTVELSEVPADKKINIIKVVRELTGLGLKEAKDLVEAGAVPLVKASQIAYSGLSTGPLLAAAILVGDEAGARGSYDQRGSASFPVEVAFRREADDVETARATYQMALRRA